MPPVLVTGGVYNASDSRKTVVVRVITFAYPMTSKSMPVSCSRCTRRGPPAMEGVSTPPVTPRSLSSARCSAIVSATPTAMWPVSSYASPARKRALMRSLPSVDSAM